MMHVTESQLRKALTVALRDSVSYGRAPEENVDELMGIMRRQLQAAGTGTSEPDLRQTVAEHEETLMWLLAETCSELERQVAEHEDTLQVLQGEMEVAYEKLDALDAMDERIDTGGATAHNALREEIDHLDERLDALDTMDERIDRLEAIIDHRRST